MKYDEVKNDHNKLMLVAQTLCESKDVGYIYDYSYIKLASISSGRNETDFVNFKNNYPNIMNDFPFFEELLEVYMNINKTIEEFLIHSEAKDVWKLKLASKTEEEIKDLIKYELGPEFLKSYESIDSKINKFNKDINDLMSAHTQASTSMHMLMCDLIKVLTEKGKL